MHPSVDESVFIWDLGIWEVDLVCVWAFENEKVLIVCIQHLV